jgi:hypothetical protein
MLSMRAERVDAESGDAETGDGATGPAGMSYGPLFRYGAAGGAAGGAAPLVGVPLLIEAERRWGAVSYTRAAIDASRTFHTGAAAIAPLLSLHAVTSSAPIDVLPSLGDQHLVPGLRWGELRGRARIVGGIDAAYPVAGAYIRLAARTGAVANSPRTLRDAHFVSGAALSLVLQSAIGSIEAGYGRATEGDGRFDVSLGRSF